MTDPATGPTPPYPSWPDPTSQAGEPSPWARPGTEAPPASGTPAAGAPPAAADAPPPAGTVPPPTMPPYPPVPGYPPAPGYQPVPGYPAMPSYPVQAQGVFYPVSGYYVPQYPVGFQGVRDTLVPGPGEGFGGWWRRVWSAFGRAWLPLALIMVVTSALPTFVFGLATDGLAQRWIVTDPAENTVYVDWSAGRELIAVSVVFFVLSAFLDGIGWSAAIWAITRRAAGAPAPFGAAFAFGLRNCARVGGLLILTELICAAGMAALLVPGYFLARAGAGALLLVLVPLALYFPIVTSLVTPFAVFERSGAVAGSFRTVNRNFGAVLGRYAAMGGTLLGGALVASCLVGVAIGAGQAGTTTVDGPVSGSATVGGIVGDVIIGLVSVALSAIIAGVAVVTYAEMRGRSVAITTQDLNAALDR